MEDVSRGFLMVLVAVGLVGGVLNLTFAIYLYRIKKRKKKVDIFKPISVRFDGT